jgi:uncharacterized protein
VTVHLLDVNVLIALIDPNHVQHEQAHAWFGPHAAQGFATCPITENGLIRIVGHPKYPNSPGAPSVVAAALQGLRALPSHVFWPDSISLLDASLVKVTRLSSHAQVSDTYLLALAKKNGGKLATLDQRLLADAVVKGQDALLLI